MRDEPVRGEEVTLVVTGNTEESGSIESDVVDENDLDTLSAAIENVGGTVEDRLQFGAVRVRIPQEQIAALCELDGIESIETAHTLGITGDASEDVGDTEND